MSYLASGITQVHTSFPLLDTRLASGLLSRGGEGGGGDLWGGRCSKQPVLQSSSAPVCHEQVAVVGSSGRWLLHGTTPEVILPHYYFTQTFQQRVRIFFYN